MRVTSDGVDYVSVMSGFSNSDRPAEEPVRPRLDLGAWREQPVEDPFEDSKVRARIGEAIVRPMLKAAKFSH